MALLLLHGVLPSPFLMASLPLAVCLHARVCTCVYVFMSKLPFSGSCCWWVVDAFSEVAQGTYTACLAHKKLPHSLCGDTCLRSAPLITEEKQSFSLACQCVDTVTSVVSLRALCQSQEHEVAIQIVLSSCVHPACGRLTVCFLATC